MARMLRNCDQMLEFKIEQAETAVKTRMAHEQAVDGSKRLNESMAE